MRQASATISGVQGAGGGFSCRCRVNKHELMEHLMVLCRANCHLLSQARLDGTYGSFAGSNW